MTGPSNSDRTAMQKPSTPEEIQALHQLLRSDPQRYLDIVNRWIEANPDSSHGYFDRHLGWMRVGEPRLALDDISKAIELDPKAVDFMARGNVYRHMGEYVAALQDYDHGETLNPAEWQADEFGLLYQADAHAHLGDEAAALAYCARLPDDFWTPGVQGAPPGDKMQIASALRRIAAETQAKRSGGKGSPL